MPSSVRPAANTVADAASVIPSLDAAIEELRAGSRTWSALTLSQRIRLLRSIRATVATEAEDWALTAARAKGLDLDSPLVGEEWLTGPYATVVAIDAYIETLTSLRVGASPLDHVRVDTAPGDRVRVHAFPTSAVDGLLVSGFSGEVWLRPGVTLADAQRKAGLGQLLPNDSGGVGLVLGAGNITSIPVLDVLYELIAHNRVSILKINPTQDPLAPVFGRALAPLISLGLLRIVQGGGEVGAALTEHAGIDHVHITGAARTFETVVFGRTATGKRRARPRLSVPITAELGGVSPIIVVPGKWSDADLRFQAEHVATMRLHNSGHNCVAGQVVILSADWAQRERFLAEVEAAMSRAPQRPVWYPGAQARLAEVADEYPGARWSSGHTRAVIEVGTDADPTPMETTEYFVPALGVVTLPGNGQEFLDAAVEYANARLTGTLGANLLIDPDTEAALGDGFEHAVAELRYGTVAINTWTGVAFGIPTMPWGAYPGGTLEDVQSGIGVVHNALLLDDVERGVMRGPFRPFPRSTGALIGPGTFSALPRPPWFVTSPGAADGGRLLTRFRIRPRLTTLLGILESAFRS
ncbi:aldehyde dehydrogenase family protein [Microbacterium schleiferi]|uniref:aldehyde dehydrogenase family protein n=2 Tax=Microbacterium TaxID=33882 RepID=UPI001D171880|nr:aldehyde dehydrogenase family protein [Microbacterium schleiferi]MCC4268825.1 aldehyde dehydrogenase family protein [Microbacterium schleiferi]